MAGLAAAFGSGAMTNTIGDIEDADVILVTGSNTTENHPVYSTGIKRSVRNGKAKLIVIEPRKIKLAEMADQWLRPDPGTDVAWINGLINVIINDDLQNSNFIKERCDGFDELKEITAKYTPDYVSEITGIPADSIIQAAKTFVSAKKQVSFTAWGSHSTQREQIT